MKYEGSKREVMVGGHLYKAFYPKQHSNVTGLIVETWDENADDEWANITAYTTVCYVLKKESHWQEVYKGPTCGFTANNLKVKPNIDEILYAFEDESVRRKIDKENEIQHLKTNIKENIEDNKQMQKRLKELGE